MQLYTCSSINTLFFFASYSAFIENLDKDDDDIPCGSTATNEKWVEYNVWPKKSDWLCVFYRVLHEKDSDSESDENVIHESAQDVFER